jgi:hypothetical protein
MLGNDHVAERERDEQRERWQREREERARYAGSRNRPSRGDARNRNKADRRPQSNLK